jgi:hypothetical protein
MGFSAREARKYMQSRQSPDVANLSNGATSTPPDQREKQPQTAAQQDRQAQQRGSNQTAPQDNSIKGLTKQLKKKKKEYKTYHVEVKAFRQMQIQQMVPISVTLGATVFEFADGGTFSIIVTMFAIAIRAIWFFMQSPKVKLWLRVHAIKQSILLSILSLVPILGLLLQPDLISTAVVTPWQVFKKILSLTKKGTGIKKEIKQLEIQIRQASQVRR